MKTFSAASILLAIAGVVTKNHWVYAVYSNISATSVPVTPFTISATQSDIVFTYTNTLVSGLTETDIGPQGTGEVTFVIAGPTTFVSIFTAAPNQLAEIYAAAPPSSATQCFGTGVTTQPGRYVTYADQVTIITAPTVLTTTSYIYDSSASKDFTSIIKNTYTGPTTIVTTVTTILGPGPDTDPAGALPGQICGGFCGGCQLYYPSVNVFYWPVASPNTACLSTATVTPASAVARDMHGYQAVPRQLLTNATTLVSDGFTFTSPSAYIAIPTISAADMCGIVGDIHTDVTLPVAAGQLSTVIVGNDGEYSSFPFDFADALCPPASVADVFHISFVGEGYRPIIVPPPALTTIDPEWNIYGCFPGDPFQGNDPPYALTPAANLNPVTTTHALDPDTTAASPSSSHASLPVQTISMFNPQPVSSPLVVSPVLSSSTTPSLRSSYTAIATPISPPSTGPDSPEVPQSSTTLAIAGALPPVTPSSDGIPPQTAPSPTVISLAGQSFTLNSASVYVAGTATLTPGGPAITISNTPISLAPSASFAVVAGSSTQTIPLPLPFSSPSPTPYILTLPGLTLTVTSSAMPVPAVTDKIFTLDGSTYTADSASAFIVGTQVLAPGAVVTVSGTPVSLGVGATDVVVGTSTEALGGVIISAFGGGAPGATGTIVPFRGGGSSLSARGSRWAGLAMGAGGGILGTWLFG